MRHRASRVVLLVCAVAVGTAAGPIWAEGRPATLLPVERAGAWPVDTLPESERPWMVRGASVVEGAWTRDEPGVLQVFEIAAESRLPGGISAGLEMQAKWGHDGVPFPSSQGLSSLDADDFVGLGEAWVEWRSPERVRIRAGWLDANREFASVAAALDFANPSFGLSPALAALPTYPLPAPSVNLFVRWPASTVGVGGGASRRADGEWSVVGQVSGEVPRLGSYAWSAGWCYPLGGSLPSAGFEPGAYLIVERPVEGFSPFVKVAAAGEPDLRHVAVGWTSPLPLPSLDARLGIAGSLVRGGTEGTDAVAEAFLVIGALPWLLLQPDVQLRFADGAVPAAAVLLRITVER